jgi:mRNA-degrading endonuclease RelE of RelBE toxin-antitoxin system
MRRLDRQTAGRVRDAILRLANTGQGDVRRLQGIDPPEWRLRVGEWRVRFAYDFERRTIQVLRVLPRGRAYRD